MASMACSKFISSALHTAEYCVDASWVPQWSASLDLAYVAAGRLDAFWEVGLSQWDIAAGALLIREAGGLVADIDASENFLDSGNIVCGSPKCFKAVLQVVKPLLA